MKDDYIKIRFTAAEKKQIKETADNSGLTISSYIRYLIAKERKERERGGNEQESIFTY